MRTVVWGVMLSLVLGSGMVIADESEPEWDLVDGVAAVVGGRPVLMSEVAAAVALEEAKLKAKQRAGLSADAVAADRAKVRDKVLKALIDNTLLLLGGEEQCPADSECGGRVAGEVDKRVGQFLEGTKDNPDARERFLRARGMGTLDQYRASIRDELLRQLFVGMELGKGVEISPQEAIAEMERRFGGKKARDQGCQGILVREMGMEHIEFPMDPTAGFDAVMARYEAAYRCYLRISSGQIDPNQVEEECAKDGEVQLSQTGADESMRLNETSSFAPAYREVFDAALAKGNGEFSEPFMLGKLIMMIRLIDVRARCITEDSEQAEIVEGLMGRLAEQRQSARLEAILDQLRSLHPVELRTPAQ